MKNSSRGKRKPTHFVMDIVIGILCVLVIGAGVFAVSMINEDWNFSYDVESFYYRLQNENYSQMVEMYHTNEAAGVKANEELKQYYGIAKYFEAASYYKAYEEAGDKANAEKYMNAMEEAEREMRDLTFVSDTICEKLGIE